MPNQSHHRFAACLPPSLALAAILATALTSCRPAQDIHRVTVSGTDYAFGALPAIRPGLTAFGFENRGKVKHEMILARLKEGVTLKQVLDLAQSGADPDSLADAAGVLFAGPGQRSGGELLVQLTPGRTYAMVCTFRDAKDKPPHVALGMVTSFTAQ